MDLGGGQVQDWMVLSIQESVSGSICQFMQIYACFDCVVINHQRGEIARNMAPLGHDCDFGDCVTTY
jgi:hypothetical protein